MSSSSKKSSVHSTVPIVAVESYQHSSASASSHETVSTTSSHDITTDTLIITSSPATSSLPSTSSSPDKLTPHADATLTPPCWLASLLLFIISLSTINNFFGYHSPGAIAASLQAKYHLTSSELGYLFTIYSAPNVVLVFIGGILIDRYGVRITSLVFNLFMFIGLVIFALAPVDHPLPFMLLGRLLLGFGECLCASASTMIGLWFKGSWLTFGMGFNQAFVQLFGSAPSFFLLPLLLKYDNGVELALWVTAGVGLISLLANVIFVIIDIKFDHLRPREITSPQEEDETDLQDIEQTETSQLISKNTHTHHADAQKHSSSNTTTHTYQSITDTSHQNTKFTPKQLQKIDSSLRSIQQEREDERHIDLGLPVSHEAPLTSSSNSEHKSMTDILSSFPTLFWLVLAMQSLLSPILYTFTAFGPLFFMQKYGISESEAGSATSVLYVTIIFAPIAGAVIDKIGYRSIIQICFSALIPITFTVMHLTNITPYMLMSILGCIFAVTESNGLAMIAEVSPMESLGSAYGLLGCGISLALLFEPALVGYLYEQTGTFIPSTLLFIALGVCGFCTSVIIFIIDRNGNNIMSGPKPHAQDLFFTPSLSRDDPDHIQDEESTHLSRNKTPTKSPLLAATGPIPSVAPAPLEFELHHPRTH